MGSGCVICKRDGINSPLKSRDVSASWRSQATRPASFLEVPCEPPKSCLSPPRRNSTSQNEDTACLREPSRSEAKAEEEHSSGDSWVAVARRDNSAESSGKSSDCVGGVLLEFKTKRDLPLAEREPRTIHRKTIDSAGDSDGSKSLLIRRLLTPCFDQNETASFGNKNRKDTDDFYKQVVSCGETKEQAKDESLHSLQKKVSRFSASSSVHDSVVTVTKCATHVEVALAQGKITEQAGANESLTIQRGSSLSTTPVLMMGSMADLVAKVGGDSPAKRSQPAGTSEEGGAGTPGNNTTEKGGKEEARREIPKSESGPVPELPRRLVAARRSMACQRIVKSIDHEQYQNYKQKVCKNVLKDAPKLRLSEARLERKETNTKSTFAVPLLATGDGFFNSSSISPINDIGGACNSSVVAGWETSTLDRLTDIMKGNGTPPPRLASSSSMAEPLTFPKENCDAPVREPATSTFSNYMQRMTKKSRSNALQLPASSRQEDTLSVTETASVVAKKSDDGNKYINQYMIVKGLGRYPSELIIARIEGATVWSSSASTPSCTGRLP